MDKEVLMAEVVADDLTIDQFLNFKLFMEMKTKLLITGLALVALTTLAGAQDQETGQRQQNGKGKGSTFVDANKNGICDNYENRATTSTATAGNNNCQGYGHGLKQGHRHGSGQQGMRQGRGYGKNFIDANKNGICDLRETPTKK